MHDVRLQVADCYICSYIHCMSFTSRRHASPIYQWYMILIGTLRSTTW